MGKKKAKSDAPTFEESLAELESIVDELESGDLGLSEALSGYELGVKHLRHCYKQLESAERKIEQLSGFDAQGNPIVEPFDEQNGPDDGTSSSRSRKRTAKRKRSSTSGDDSPSVDDAGTLF